jgi:hypothetical protein
MPGVFSILEFVAELKAIDHDLEALGPKIVEKACQIVQKKAKAAIGKEHELWAPLAESTIRDKAAHGYKTPAPLLRTGESSTCCIAQATRWQNSATIFWTMTKTNADDGSGIGAALDRRGRRGCAGVCS